jgi:protein TonB
MSDRFIEKSFLVLLLISFLLHVGAGVLLYYYPEARQQPPREPVFIDLQQVPDLKQPEQPRQQETKRLSEQRVHVEREMVPRGLGARENSAPSIPRAVVRKPQSIQPPWQQETPRLSQRETPVAPGSSVSSLLKPRSQTSQQSQQPQFLPGNISLSKIENQIYKQYEKEIEDGKVMRLNTEDSMYGSFMKRVSSELERTYVLRKDENNQLVGVPNAVTMVILYFDKNGDPVLDKTIVVSSSGYKGLDDFVMDSIKRMGPLGKLPKQHKGDYLEVLMGFRFINMFRGMN